MVTIGRFTVDRAERAAVLLAAVYRCASCRPGDTACRTCAEAALAMIGGALTCTCADDGAPCDACGRLNALRELGDALSHLGTHAGSTRAHRQFRALARLIATDPADVDGDTAALLADLLADLDAGADVLDALRAAFRRARLASVMRRDHVRLSETRRRARRRPVRVTPARVGRAQLSPRAPGAVASA